MSLPGPRELRGALTDSTEQMVEDLQALVECESPSNDLDAVAACADLVSDIGAGLLGASPCRLDVGGRVHLRWTFGRPRVLLLGHFDTVWPLGSISDHPFRVAGGVATGPGCFDMKAGLVQMMHALSALDTLDGVQVLLTSDEELGAPTSRPIIEQSARRVEAALVLEGSADGALKVERKGIAVYTVHAHGRAAHAGLEPERGINATVEIAHQIVRITELADIAAGTTVTATELHSGSAANTVPAEAQLSIDIRAASRQEMQRVAQAVRRLEPVLPGSRVSIERVVEHPPLPRSSSHALFALAQRAAELLGLPPPPGAAVGGASDGNLTAGVGTPTLDGLGAVGGGAHADDEHVHVESMADRAALVAMLAHTLQGGLK